MAMCPLSLRHSRLSEHFLKFSMVDSCPSHDVNPDRSSHQLEPGTRPHYFSPLHSSDHLSNLPVPWFVAVSRASARLAAITMSSIRSLGQDLPGRAPTRSQAPICGASLII